MLFQDAITSLVVGSALPTYKS